MAVIRSTGGATGETSYYSALENVLNELGVVFLNRMSSAMDYADMVFHCIISLPGYESPVIWGIHIMSP